MARCMLCSSPAGEADEVCARCGGAVEHDAPPGDGGAPAGGVDLGKAAAPGAGTGWPGESEGPFSEPATGPSSGPFSGPAGGTAATPDPGGFGAAGGPDATGAFGYGPPPGPWGATPPGAPGSTPYGPLAAGAGGYGYGYGAAPVPFTPAPPQEGMAIAAFIASVLGLVLSFGCGVAVIACPVGVVLGHTALRKMEREGTGGRGLAIAAVCVGWVGTALIVIGLAVLLAIGITEASG